MSYSYDLSTDIGKIRLAIPDNIQADAVFTDEELQVFLDVEGSWRSAAALALETMASNELLVMKMVEVKDVKVSGSDRAVALLLKRASLLREQDTFDGSFDVIPIVYDDFSLREHVRAIISREG